jgi:thymidylate synthase ThyX
MNMYSCQVLLDSVNPFTGQRLWTVLVRYPMLVAKHVLTHRKFSRNTASNRARRNKTLLEEVSENPFVPEHFGSEQRGMVAGDGCDVDQEKAREVWLNYLRHSLEASKQLSELGVHKELSNRPLELFQHCTQIISTTDFQNFLNLRLAADAQFQVRALAQVVHMAIAESTPVARIYHIPYLLDNEQTLPLREQVMISVARCARISYMNPEDAQGVDANLALVRRLAEHRHASPFEHVAVAMPHNGSSGNFDDWRQLRKELEECEWDLQAAIALFLKGFGRNWVSWSQPLPKPNLLFVPSKQHQSKVIGTSDLSYPPAALCMAPCSTHHEPLEGVCMECNAAWPCGETDEVLLDEEHWFVEDVPGGYGHALVVLWDGAPVAAGCDHLVRCLPVGDNQPPRLRLSYTTGDAVDIATCAAQAGLGTLLWVDALYRCDLNHPYTGVPKRRKA